MKNAAPTDQPITNIWRTIIVYALITLVGFNLRSVILAVPPVLPLIQRDLGLSYTATGLLTALPVLMLGGGAWSFGLLVRRIGGRTSVTIGLALLSAGALLRAFLPSVHPVWGTGIELYLFTALLSLGIALAQTAVPVLARFWFPRHVGLVSALFSDGLIIGEAVAAGVTVPLMLQFLGRDNWTGTFVFWGVPVVAMLALWLWLAPRTPATDRAPVLGRGDPLHSGPHHPPDGVQSPDRGPSLGERYPQGSPPLRGTGVPERSEPIDRAPRFTVPTDSAPDVILSEAKDLAPRVNALHLGIILGMGSLVYFGMNGWIASYNQAIHHADLTPLALAILNAAQLPVSLGITFFAQQLAGRRWPFIVAGIVCTIAISGWIFTPDVLDKSALYVMEPFWAAFLGGASALVFTLGIALPPLLASPKEVARLTGTTFSLSYGVAFVGPFVGGGLWDLFGLPALAFLPVVVAGIALVILGALLPSRAAFGLITAERPPAAPGRPQGIAPTKDGAEPPAI